MTQQEKIDILQDYMSRSNESVFEFIRDNKDRCANDVEYHRMAKEMLASVWLTHQIKDGLEAEMSKNQTAEHHNATTHDTMLTSEEKMKWVNSMKNADGTTGAHWSMEQTTSVAKKHGIKFEHIGEMDWWVAMNLAYSDFFATQNELNLLSDSADAATKYYVKIAKSILFDADGAKPKARLAGWYHAMR